MTAKCTLGGVPLLALAPIRWTLKTGTRPHEETFEVDRERGQALFDKGDELELVIGRERFRGLSVLNLEPGGDPRTVRVVVADRRWRWPRRHYTAAYNIRRRMSDTRSVANGFQSNQVQNFDVSFAKHSIDGGQPYTAETMLRDILENVATEGFEVGPVLRTTAVQNVEIDDPGDFAVARALAHVPGVNVYIDADGICQTIDELDGSEDAVIRANGVPLDGTGSAHYVRRDKIRPKSFLIHFDREFDIRFDYTTAQTVSVRDTRPKRLLENVLPCPDPFLDVPANSERGTGERSVSFGTWLTFDEAYAAWNDTTANGAYANTARTPPNIGEGPVRKYWLAGFNPYMDIQYGRDLAGNPDPRWVRRLNAIQMHWRQTFRIPPAWIDRIKSWRANTSGMVDFEWGTRAPAMAFTDWIIKPSYRGLVKSRTDNNALGYEVRGYPTSGGTLYDNGSVAPADIQVLDEANGIIRVFLLRDIWGDGDRISPGRFKGTGLTDLPVESAGLAWARFSEIGALSETWKLAVVFSASPAAPKGLGRLAAVEVSAEDAAAQLGKPDSIGASLAEPYKLRIHAGVTTARYALLDTPEGDPVSNTEHPIDKVFLDGGQAEDLGYPADSLANPQEIEFTAQAHAAAMMAQLTDRWEGRYGVPLNGDIVPTGNLRRVTHSLDPSGVAITTMTFPSRVRSPDIQAFMPESIRRMVFRQVQP